MIDFNKWVYSKDIAEWISERASLDIGVQIDCICSAPHRTLKEKLEGLRELQSESGENRLADIIADIGMLQSRSCLDVPMWQFLFKAETFYQGQREWLTPMIFRTAKKAEEEISMRIKRSATEHGLNKKDYHGVVQVFRRMGSPYCLVHEEDFVTRYDGEVLFRQIPYYGYGKADDLPDEMGNFRCLKIPYSSGTIVAVEKNPFFPSIKGVLVNSTEPEQEGFADDPYNQWLIYAEQPYTEQTHGIGIVNLRDDYIPFSCSSDLTLPYKQYITAYDGKLKENEIWLEELSKLIKTDKHCVRGILHDRRPNHIQRIEGNRKRLAYVRELAARGIYE